MKSLLLLAAWAINLLTSWLSGLIGWTDWSLVGWAFAGSTAYVVWEVLQKPPIVRKGWERLAMVGVGMVVSLGLNAWLSEKFGIPIVPMTIALGAGGYKLFTLFQKKADNPSVDDLTGLKKP